MGRWRRSAITAMALKEQTQQIAGFALLELNNKIDR
jgi:hypothetical protein